jgi:3D (Asp-Asp-Asp) domain-containing protein
MPQRSKLEKSEPGGDEFFRRCAMNRKVLFSRVLLFLSLLMFAYFSDDISEATSSAAAVGAEVRLEERTPAGRAQLQENLSEQAPMAKDVLRREEQLSAIEHATEHERAQVADREIQRGRQITLESTGYTCGPESTGKYPSAPDYCRTASGYTLKPGDKVVAMGNKYQFGTAVMIPGYGLAMVRDRGGAVSDNHIDLYFERVEDALKWGRKRIMVTIM